MHGVMQRRGYQQIGCYLLHRADAVQAPVEQIGKLTGDDAEAVWSFLNRAKMVRDESAYLSAEELNGKR